MTWRRWKLDLMYKRPHHTYIRIYIKGHIKFVLVLVQFYMSMKWQGLYIRIYIKGHITCIYVRIYIKGHIKFVLVLFWDDLATCHPEHMAPLWNQHSLGGGTFWVRGKCEYVMVQCHWRTRNNKYPECIRLYIWHVGHLIRGSGCIQVSPCVRPDPSLFLPLGLTLVYQLHFNPPMPWCHDAFK